MSGTFKLALALVLVAALASVAGAGTVVPVVDGHFSASEGYTTGYNVTFDVENGPSGVTGGELWTYQDPTTKDVTIAFFQPLSIVDNSYGTGSVGWGTNAPSGKHHNFKDLKGSDSGEFTFLDGTGAKVLDIQVDYISGIKGGGYGSLGVTGGDGKVFFGSAADVLAAETSLAYNFNTLGYDGFTKDSPSTGSSTAYADPASAPGWDFYVTYELTVSGDLFGDLGTFSVVPTLMHDSPNKIAKNKVTPEVQSFFTSTAVPTPGALPAGLLLLGLLFLLRRRAWVGGRRASV